MLIIVTLLIVLSLPRVWLKPTLDESEFVDITEDDITRDKRQAQLFDLIHQAIEKYANCANEHLAPLKSLANYKRYETLVYPEDYSPSSEAILDAINQQNKPNLKCTKVNLCSVEKQPTHIISGYNLNRPTVLGKSYYSTSDISQENRGHYPYKTKDHVRLPIYKNNRLGLKSPSNNNPSYTQNISNKNNKYYFSALNRALLNRLFNRPTSTKNTTDSILGSRLENATSSGKSKICTCSINTTEKAPTTLESDESILKGEEETTEEIKETSTDPQPVLGSKLNNTKSSGKIKSCGCLKKTTPKMNKNPDLLPRNTTKLDTITTPAPDALLASDVRNIPDPLLRSKLDNTTTPGKIKNPDKYLDPLQGNTKKQEIKPTTPVSVALLTNAHNNTNTSNVVQNFTCPTITNEKSPSLVKNDPKLNQNLNLLVLQLDLKSHNESKENLKQILKDLKALKSAINISERSFNKIETTTITSKAISNTTSTPQKVNSTTTLATTTAANIIAPRPSIAPLITATKLNITDNSQSLKSSNFKNTAISQMQLNLKSVNSTLLPSTNFINTTSVIQTIHLINKTKNNATPNLTAFKDFSFNSNLNKTDDDITTITSSAPLQLNITNNKDLSRLTNQVHNLVSSMANKTIQGNLKQNLNTSKDVKATNITIIRKTILSTNNQTLGVNNLNITEPKLDIGKMLTKDHLNNVNDLIANLNDTMFSNTAQHNTSGSLINSTITISITNNGSFKKIDVEQKSDNSSNRNLEINEKEQMNLGSPKIRSIDMRGTGSRSINYFKTPHEKDPYDEPLLSEIYPSKSKLKSKNPLSIYWHKIEQKPIKSKEISTGLWKTFQSHGLEDYEDDNSGDKENLSSFLRDCVDYEDLSESHDSESAENKRKRELCKRSTFIT